MTVLYAVIILYCIPVRNQPRTILSEAQSHSIYEENTTSLYYNLAILKVNDIYNFELGKLMYDNCVENRFKGFSIWNFIPSSNPGVFTWGFKSHSGIYLRRT